ncbi:Death domain [Nesidiocoris tenuis]|uniref:Death domain n=1 Tax=Nesidiocoris tenuis TaxID=355587 RepID=A0ABN7BBE2_9HEMI|nr:Death domain [Nesidiocoris tenuis]
MLSGLKTKNPALERIRDNGLNEERIKQKTAEEQAEELAVILSRFHASFLFVRENDVILQKLCIIMSSIPAGIHTNSWNVLALELGYSPLQVECVKNTSKDDNTFLVLKSYATRPDADLGRIVRALKNIRRMDAFMAVQQGLTALAAKYDQNEDSGFSSTECSNEPADGLLYPPDFVKIRSQLEAQVFITMKHLNREIREARNERREEIVKARENANRQRHREDDRVQGAAVVRQPKARARYNVMITYADDGTELAKMITKTFRTSQGKRPQIGVLLLDEHVDKVLENPEHFIIHYFHKMNYVIPILTDGYMRAIGRAVQDEGGNLDNQYVQFVHDLCSKYYRRNSCRNDKIRCVVPIEKRSILNHTHRKIDPIMAAYEYDTNIEELAKRITRTIDDDD